MYMYNNSPSYDNRKTGLALDIDFTTFGIETVYGSFGEKGVMGVVLPDRFNLPTPVIFLSLVTLKLVQVL